ncbi:MAG: four helix bundle protein [Gemmatimonadaceae bacterium]
MTYDEWEATVPAAVKADVIWHVQAFRLATFLAACVEEDTRAVASDPRFSLTISQLVRAAGSVGANIAEGYPRQSARDRVRYYEYALGSASEMKVWYLSVRVQLGVEILEERLSLLRSISRLLATMVRTASYPSLSSTRVTLR